jgi:hypothetical protein
MSQNNDSNEYKRNSDSTIKQDVFVESGDFGETTENINVEGIVNEYIKDRCSKF